MKRFGSRQTKFDKITIDDIAIECRSRSGILTPVKDIWHISPRQTLRKRVFAFMSRHVHPGVDRTAHVKFGKSSFWNVCEGFWLWWCLGRGYGGILTGYFSYVGERSNRKMKSSFRCCKMIAERTGCAVADGCKCLKILISILAVMSCLIAGIPAHADSLDSLIERLDRLEEENQQLRKEIDELKARQIETDPQAAAPESKSADAKFVNFDSEFGYDILDPTTNINRKQLLILDRKKDGILAPNRLHVHGAVTAISNYQSSNVANKFGYLMRHPTAANQVGKTVSEAVIHSVQLGLTATLDDWITGNVEILYDPEQSFGTGTNTALARNQLQVRRAYVLFGNLDRSPFYASLGKMAIPFGLTDTVNPFTASTVWHAFGGLANGVTLGYANEGLNVSLMGVQGGAQFRAANTSVHKTATPSKLNNFAVDANYTWELNSDGTFLLGGSFQRGSAYCQDYPVSHFMPCKDNNPAFEIYGRLVHDNLTVNGEFAQTTDDWPGTFNPDIPQFAASKVTSFGIGAKYRYNFNDIPVDLSTEFSRFKAGPTGAPWERQDQLVLGSAWFIQPNVKLFSEYIHTEGYAPLNFISGGHTEVVDTMAKVINDRSHSDSSAQSDILMIGANIAF